VRSGLPQWVIWSANFTQHLVNAEILLSTVDARFS
jgi:hypothetical protein